MFKCSHGWSYQSSFRASRWIVGCHTAQTVSSGAHADISKSLLSYLYYKFWFSVAITSAQRGNSLRASSVPFRKDRIRFCFSCPCCFAVPNTRMTAWIKPQVGQQCWQKEAVRLADRSSFALISVGLYPPSCALSLGLYQLYPQVEGSLCRRSQGVLQRISARHREAKKLLCPIIRKYLLASYTCDLGVLKPACSSVVKSNLFC